MDGAGLDPARIWTSPVTVCASGGLAGSLCLIMLAPRWIYSHGMT